MTDSALLFRGAAGRRLYVAAALLPASALLFCDATAPASLCPKPAISAFKGNTTAQVPFFFIARSRRSCNFLFTRAAVNTIFKATGIKSPL
ncbi:hypothetical protein Ahy_A10g050282 isoform A [Arachis hypogaea]|uniref:Uncharacterized protein n=1 Tax=Arachis hypogaea TaxID=3818 RepID=A0A445B913_ARAHY|nr:hypothetical protein Ahy_A10g050282 isoform A [Arachis hypogaea]